VVQLLSVVHFSLSAGGAGPKCCLHRLMSAIVPFIYLHCVVLFLIPVPHVTEHYIKEIHDAISEE